MKHSDIEELARKACLEEAVQGLFYASSEGLSRFAALVLEKAAENLYLMPLAAPNTAEESAYLMASIDAGNTLRAMSAALQSGDRGECA